jgi:hypothetical protein
MIYSLDTASSWFGLIAAVLGTVARLSERDFVEGSTIAFFVVVSVSDYLRRLKTFASSFGIEVGSLGTTSTADTWKW